MRTARSVYGIVVFADGQLESVIPAHRHNMGIALYVQRGGEHAERLRRRLYMDPGSPGANPKRLAAERNGIRAA